jgi:hypothetical protein
MHETSGPRKDPIIQQLIDWSAAQDAVRALLLFGSRNAPAIEVTERLGYTYPHDQDRRMVAFLRRVQPFRYRSKGDKPPER